MAHRIFKLRLVHENAPFPRKRTEEDFLTKTEELEFLKEHLKRINKAARQTRLAIKEKETELKQEKKRKPK